MRFPGEVWLLPPEARQEGDPKPRRHVLLTRCEDEGDVGVLSYASTSAIEAAFGGASVLVDPFARGYQHTGFVAPTHVTPCRLVSAASEDMWNLKGRLIDEMPEVRRALARALGIGTGTARSGVASGSLRGRVIELSVALAEECGARFAVILSEPGYSLRRRYQIVALVLDPAEYETETDDVLVTGEAWVRAIDLRLSAAILPATPPVRLSSARHRAGPSGGGGRWHDRPGGSRAGLAVRTLTPVRRVDAARRFPYLPGRHCW